MCLLSHGEIAVGQCLLDRWPHLHCVSCSALALVTPDSHVLCTSGLDSHWIIPAARTSSFELKRLRNRHQSKDTHPRMQARVRTARPSKSPRSTSRLRAMCFRLSSRTTSASEVESGLLFESPPSPTNFAPNHMGCNCWLRSHVELRVSMSDKTPWNQVGTSSTCAIRSHPIRVPAFKEDKAPMVLS